MNTRDRIYLDLEAERLRQERKWGVQTHTVARWMLILDEERLEATREANDVSFQRTEDLEQFRKELIEEAAVCMAIVEDLDTR